MSNAYRVYKIDGYNVNKYVIGMHPALFAQSKPKWGDLPSLPKIQLQLSNQDSQFSTRYKYSLFGTRRLKDLSLTVQLIYPGSTFTEWSGIIESVDEDYQKKQITIHGNSHYQRALDMPCLIFLNNATPAELSRELFILYNIPVNTFSYSAAINALGGLVTCQLDPNLLQSQITLQEMQKHLATAGYARIYYYNGEMYYQVYSSAPLIGPIAVNDKDIMTYPHIVKEEPTKPRIYSNDPFPYTVTMTLGDVHSPAWSLGANTESLSFGANDPVKIIDLTSAQQVADQWQIIHDLTTFKIDFAVLPDFAAQFTLDSYISLTWTAGGFDATILEIISIDRTDPRYTKLSARTL